MGGLGALGKLTKLYVDGNRIGSLKGLEQLTRLEELHMSNQKLAPEVDFELDIQILDALAPSLMVLQFKGNQLREPQPLAVLSSLQRLNLAGNRIDSVDSLAVVLEVCQFLNNLDVQGNPLCSQPKFRDRIILSSPYLMNLDGKEITDQQRDTLVRIHANKRRQRFGSQENLAERANGVDAGSIAVAGVPTAREHRLPRLLQKA